MNRIANTFTWEIGSFQEYVRNISHGSSIYSQKFWIPKFPLDKFQNENDIKNPTLWQLRLFPNGDNSIESINHISLFLKAIQTPYEKLNEINGRNQKYIVIIGRTLINENKKILIKNTSISTNYFVFNNVSSGWGHRKFVELNSIFPDGNKSQDVDLFVQITFFNDNDITKEEGLLDINKPMDYFENESFSDIEFTFECGSKIRAHRVILAFNSEYFKNMLNGGWKEQDMDVIPIKETSYETFRAILYFVYTGKLLNLDNFETQCELFKRSDMMLLGNLKKLVVKKMIEFINEDNWDVFLLLGSKDYILKFTGLEYAAHHWEMVKTSEGMLRLYSNYDINEMEELILFVNKRKEIVDFGF
ncbi:18976_t:CDS:1 [Funneliformis geosporum]|uniref:12312_t:CDS:1 n=1 Tax=Funneliformis geosporum TaxID=1117311 RepID=A0A9W4SFY5_9GLOM|nr:18976_t:CDS:1 [Funneliformis geosporum]CAI2166997.1 12312_t:CDS:1 [Funneliformis geosporum]